MLRIGITGGSGSGKSNFAEFFARYADVPVLNADRVYHKLIEAPSPCTRAIAEEFGPSVLNEKGGIDRARLSALVFGEDNAAIERRERLNAIAHRFVREEFIEMLDLEEARGTRAVLLDVPLLFESGMECLCDYVIAVIAPYKSRLGRILLRDGLNEAQAEARLAAQPPDGFYTDRADCTVTNDRDPAALYAEAVRIADALLKK